MDNFKLQLCHCCDGSGKELDHKAVGRDLRRARIAKGVSQATVARRMKFSKPYVSDLEFGARNWRTDLIAKYLKALRLTTIKL